MHDAPEAAPTPPFPSEPPGAPVEAPAPPRSRLRAGLVAALLFLIIGGHAAALTYWIHLDQLRGVGVCCALVIPVLDVLRPLEAAQVDPTMIPWHLDKGIISWMVLGVREVLGGDPDYTLWFTLLCFAVTQLCLFFIGRRLHSPWAGLLAAAVLPLYPAAAFITRRWDVNVPQLPFVAAGCLFLLQSRSFNKLLPSLAFAAVAVAGTCLSPRRSENLLFLYTMGCMAGGAVLRAVLTRRGPEVGTVSRWRALFGGAAVAVVVLTVLYVFVPGFAPGGYAYYPKELQNPLYTHGIPWNHPRRLSAYLVHLYQRGFTPPMTLPLLLGMAIYTWRGKGRAELLGWFVGPTLFLSIIAKKNFYYYTLLYPVFPLFFALGLLSFPWRWLTVPVALATVGYGTVMFTARSFPETARGTRLDQVRWHTGDNRMDSLFQTIDFELDLAPRMDFPQKAQVELATRVVTAPSCTCPYLLYNASDESYDEIWLTLSEIDPCLGMLAWPEDRYSEFVGAWLVKDWAGWKPPRPMDEAMVDPNAPPAPAAAPWAELGQAIRQDPSLELAGEVDVRGTTWWLYRRPQSWFDGRCQGPPAAGRRLP